MSHSTVEMIPDDCTLTLLFRHNNSTRASLRIASVTYQPPSYTGSQALPEYISPEGEYNVEFIKNKDEVNGSSPIQVYLGGDPDLNPILLLEETEYDLLLTGDVKDAFPYIRDNSGEIALRKLHFKGDGGSTIFKLVFKSYVGKGFFDVLTTEDIRISIPFEVRSKKIGYLNEYPRMLEDISAFSTSLLLDSKSPLYLNLSLSDSNSQTIYEDFLVLDHIFSEMDLEGAYRQVKLNRHCDMFPESYEVPAGIAGYVDPSDVESMLSPNNLIPMSGGPIAGCFSPIYAVERIHIDDYDTPENRVVKDLILSIQKMVHGMISSPLHDGSAYISGRLAEMRSTIDNMASDIWLKNIGDLTMIPFGSTVLQNRSGYAEIFVMYQILGLGTMFKQDDAEKLLKGQNSRVYEVYEYWCYTRLYRCLRKMSVNKPDFPLRKSGDVWSVSIRNSNGVTFEIPAEDSILDVTLYYNKNFNRRNHRFRSYSVRLRPDYTLVINSQESPEYRFVINFDAKYKAKPKTDDTIVTDDTEIDSDCWEYDIYKMHTYRDALLQSWGSYVLFPGEESAIYPKEIDREDDFDNPLRVPSVGAIPLVPGSKTDEILEKVIGGILSDISHISSGEFSIERYGPF